MKKPELRTSTNRKHKRGKAELQYFRYPRRSEETRGECRGVGAKNAPTPLARGRSRDRRGLPAAMGSAE